MEQANSNKVVSERNVCAHCKRPIELTTWGWLHVIGPNTKQKGCALEATPATREQWDMKQLSSFPRLNPDSLDGKLVLRLAQQTYEMVYQGQSLWNAVNPALRDQWVSITDALVVFLLRQGVSKLDLVREVLIKGMRQTAEPVFGVEPEERA
jgi:hypothetical protein